MATSSLAQSIGYHPNLNLGFNPYLSPVFGYGLGIPFGAYSSISPAKSPFLNPAAGSLALNHPFTSKLHSKSIFKHIIPISDYSSSLKNKFALLKQQAFYPTTPYSLDYGFGKHYGAAIVPNNPYKGTYTDYYSKTSPALTGDPLAVAHSSPTSQLISSAGSAKTAAYSFVKPLIKAGALLTTAALLGKKTLELGAYNPLIFRKLNPTGMILNNYDNQVVTY